MEILMSKIIVESYISIIILILLLNPSRMVSQNQPGEIEIKRSGNYYWGQAYNADSIQAKLEARDDLMLRISNQISNSDALNDKSDIMVKCIRYINKPVEELTKVIAYVTREDVTNIIENRQPLIVSEIKYTEAINTSGIENPIEKSTPSLENITIEQKAEPIVKNDIPSSSTENTLIVRLITCNTGDELRTLLKNEEDKNTLVFSWDSKSYRTSVSSENFYIVLIDPIDNRIIAFLDKGKSERKDLKNEQRKIYIVSEYQNMIQVWIQLL
jgi:hypothetical protein